MKKEDHTPHPCMAVDILYSFQPDSRTYSYADLFPFRKSSTKYELRVWDDIRTEIDIQGA